MDLLVDHNILVHSNQYPKKFWKFWKKSEFFPPFGSYLQESNSLVTRKDDIWRQILHIVMASFGQSPNRIHKGCVRKCLVRLCILVVHVGLASRTWQTRRCIGHHILGGRIFDNPLEIILVSFIWLYYYILPCTVCKSYLKHRLVDRVLGRSLVDLPRSSSYSHMPSTCAHRILVCNV